MTACAAIWITLCRCWAFASRETLHVSASYQIRSYVRGQVARYRLSGLVRGFMLPSILTMVQHVLDFTYELVERRVLALASSSALLASEANIFIASDRYMIGGC